MKRIVSFVKRTFSTQKSTPSLEAAEPTYQAPTATYTEKDLTDAFYAVIHARAALKPSVTLASALSATQTERESLEQLWRLLYATLAKQFTFHKSTSEWTPYGWAVNLDGEVLLVPGVKDSVLSSTAGRVAVLNTHSHYGVHYELLAAVLLDVITTSAAANKTVVMPEDLSVNWDEDEHEEAEPIN